MNSSGSRSTYVSRLEASGRLTAMPLLAMALLSLLVYFIPGMRSTVYETPWILFALNVFFVTPLCLWVSVLALRAYLAGGLIQILCAGSGILVFGLSNLIPGFLIFEAEGPNDAVTVHNLGMLAAAVMHLTGCLLNLREAEPEESRRTRVWKAALGYGGITVFTALVWLGAFYDALPPFIVPGGRITHVRLVVLAASIIVFAVGVQLVRIDFQKRRTPFLRWYGLGLALVALGLMTVAFAVPGSVLSWIGRVTQYIGNLYLFAAALILVRDARSAGLDIEQAAAKFFLHAERDYPALVKASTSVIISADPSGRVILWNPAAEVCFGYSAGDAAGMDLAGAIAGPENEGHLREIVAERQETRLETTLRRKDGSPFPADLSAYASGEGRSPAIFFIIRDITDRRAAEQVARSREQQLNLVMDTVPALISYIDKKFRYRRVNQGYEHWFGLAAREMEGLNVRDVLGEEFWQVVRPRLEQAMAGETVTYEVQVPSRAGGMRWVHTVLVPDRDASGSVQGLVALVTDITAHKQAENELFQAKQLSDALNRISKALHSSLDADEIVQRLMQEGAALLCSDTAAVSLRQDNGWVVRNVHGMAADLLGARMSDDEERHAVLALTLRRPVAVENAFNDERFNREHMRRNNIRAVLVAPLITRDQPTGAIFFNYHREPRAFTDAEVFFAEQLASSASVAMENALFYEEIKRAGEQLRMSEERFRVLSEAAFEGIAVTERGVLLDVNEQFCRLTGYERSELVGRSVSDLTHSADRERVIENILVGRESITEHRVIRKDGATIMVEAQGKTMRHGSLERRFTSIRDITERKRMEAKMEHLASFPLLNPNPVVEADLTGRVIFSNPAAWKLFPDLVKRGASHPWLAGWEALAEAVNKDDSGRRFRELAVGGRWYLQSLQIVEKEPSFRFYGWDITDRKQAEKDLYESEQRLRFALESARLGNWDLDLSTGVANRSLRHDQIFGYEDLLPEWNYLRLLDHVVPEDRVMVDERFREAVATGRIWDVECRIVRVDGVKRWIWVRGQTMLDNVIAPLRMQGIVQDITERKQVEDALRRAKENLEEKVRERTTELVTLTENLLASRDQLRVLASDITLAEEKERKRIAAVLHDEVAQTLAAAKMRLDILRAQTAGESYADAIAEARELLGKSIRETRSLMTDISSPLLFDMGLAAACESLAERLSAGYEVQVRCEIRKAYKNLDPELKIVLFQVIRELLNNAVKHSGAGNIRIAVEDENAHILIRVMDDGKGFDTNAVGMPTETGGFGLFSIRERIIAFNGSVQIESSPGAGTTVTVTVPLGTKFRSSGRRGKKTTAGSPPF